MVNSKAVMALIVVSVLVALVAGIAVAQYASAQANSNQQGATAGYYQPQEGYNPYGSQYAGPYGYGGMGMGMCGR